MKKSFDSLPNSLRSKSHSLALHPSSKRLDFKNLGLQQTQISEPNTPKVLDKISRQESGVLKQDSTLKNSTKISLMEKNEALKLLQRHQKRLRDPQVQLDQEAKLNRLNQQLGRSIPANISDFNFSIVPNKKLSSEELNSLERKFYAFHTRLSEKYSNVISSLDRKYNRCARRC